MLFLVENSCIVNPTAFANQLGKQTSTWKRQVVSGADERLVADLKDSLKDHFMRGSENKIIVIDNVMKFSVFL